MTRASLMLLILLTSCERQESETYGFIATLGDDTTSVERVTRTGDRIMSDALGRSPAVVRRQWEATLRPDGSVRHWTMRTHFPNADAGATDLYHEVTITDSTVRLIRHAPGDTIDATYANTFPVIVPWNAFIYGTYEMLFQAAREVADGERIGQYFFEGWAEGTLGYAQLRRFDGDSIAIRSTGLSGAGIAQLDAAGRLLSYSGDGTTYKQQVQRVTDVPDIDAIAARFAEDERARGTARSLSMRVNTQTVVAGTRFILDYGQPLARGRVLVGGLIPYDQVWRTGANAATQLAVSAPVEIGGVPLDSGAYTLWTLPTRAGTQLIINRQTGQWGTQYGRAHDIARVPMQVDSIDYVEQFTIRIDTTATPGLVMEWGTFRWSVPLSVTTTDDLSLSGYGPAAQRSDVFAHVISIVWLTSFESAAPSG